MLTPGDPNTLLAVLDEIDRVVAASNALITTLTTKRQSIFKLIDDATRPPPPAPPSVPPRRRLIGPGFIYMGNYVGAWTGIDLYLGVLRRLWSEYPDRREAMQSALAAMGRTRCYVAADRQSLFDDKADNWVRKYSTTLCDGWFADTNLNPKSMRRLLPCAARAAGLSWGRDVIAYWRTTAVTAKD